MLCPNTPFFLFLCWGVHLWSDGEKCGKGEWKWKLDWVFENDGGDYARYLVGACVGTIGIVSFFFVPYPASMLTIIVCAALASIIQNRA